MSIFADAPDPIIDTKFARTLVGSLWNRYFWAIIRCKLIPNYLYLIMSLFYYSYFLFDKKGMKGVPEDERWAITFESTFRFFCVVLIFYHIFYEFLQFLRFRSEYIKDYQNLIQVASIILNLFIIVYHVFDY